MLTTILYISRDKWPTIWSKTASAWFYQPCTILFYIKISSPHFLATHQNIYHDACKWLQKIPTSSCVFREQLLCTKQQQREEKTGWVPLGHTDKMAAYPSPQVWACCCSSSASSFVLEWPPPQKEKKPTRVAAGMRRVHVVSDAICIIYEMLLTNILILWF